MESSRRSFERSREQPGLKKPRLAEEVISDRSRPFGQRPTPSGAAVTRYRSVDIDRDRDLESNDSVRGTYSQQQQQQQQQNELVIRYKTAIAELTINSKPIITNLTIIAGENLQHAKAIAAIICSHILEVPNEQKLPSLYLLDSIVKNIGRDYIKYFAVRLPEVFCKVYGQVEPSMHTSMRHLFGTWKGVFPPNSLQMIENEIGIPTAVNGSSSSSASTRPDSQSHRPAQSIHVNPKYLEARQRNQQSNRVKSTVDDSGVVHNSSEILDRITGAGSGNLLSGHPTKLLDPRREAFGRPAPVKKINPVFEDIEFTSELPRRPNIGMGRVLDQDLEKLWHEDSVTRTISGQRNGFDDKPGIKSFPPSKSSQNDVQLKASGNISSRSSSTGMNRNWKNSDEEEFMWDDIKPGYTNDHEMVGQGKFQWMDDTDERGIKSREASADMLMVEPNDAEDHRSLQNAGPHSKDGNHSSYLESLPKPRTSLSSRTGSSQSAALPLYQPPTIGTLQTEAKTNYKPLTSRYSPQVLLGTTTEQTFPQTQIPHSDLRNSQTPGLLNKMPLRPQLPPKGHLQKTQPYVPSGPKQPPTSGQTKKSNLKGDSSNHLLLKSSGKGSSSSLLDSIMKSTVVPPLSHDETSTNINILEGMVEEEEDIPIDLLPPPRVDGSSVKTSNPNPVSSLLGSLVAKGLISASKKKDPRKLESETIPSVAKNEGSLEPSKELKSLIGYEFKPAVIREPNSNVIGELVLLDGDLHHPCLICGLKVKFQEQLDKHMECHALRSPELNAFVKASRKWYGNADDWVDGKNAFPYVHECVVDNSGRESEEFDDDEMVLADESQCVCVLCGNGFEDVYSEGRGEWMFKGAVYMSISSSDGKLVTFPREDSSFEGLIVHPECITESTIDDLELK
ncbi:polyadenylation and cleavage factor homolog 4-like [Impatiens glandulifera]|uniref:polyadenylation and cleavage factor homolog 4-like n=1 Tax=Impatiens glandulifera TaxID=253017 RepID=UPI001FB09F3E|nr:polyadenylation and cleavage factor homolog 4-like [Impatiens glandulifera]